MADTKISALTAATTPLAGTEVLPIVQSSSTVKVATDDLTVKNVRSNATTGILQIAGPGTGTTRVMTTPNANFTVARTDAAQTFSGVQTFSNQVNVTGAVASGAANAGVFANSSGQFQTWVLGANTSTYGTYLLVQARSDLSSSRQLLSFDTSGNGSFDSGNVAFATAAKGVNFTANTPAAGMTSQLLNWYEEGTWTGTLTGGTTAPTTAVTATGNYTRIGNTVTITILFTNKDTTGASGQMLVTGLPFTAKAGINHIGSVTSYGLSIPNKTLNTYIAGSGTTIEFVSAADNGAWSFPNITAGASKYLYITATYFV